MSLAEAELRVRLDEARERKEREDSEMGWGLAVTGEPIERIDVIYNAPDVQKNVTKVIDESLALNPDITPEQRHKIVSDVKAAFYVTTSAATLATGPNYTSAPPDISDAARLYTYYTLPANWVVLQHPQ